MKAPGKDPPPRDPVKDAYAVAAMSIVDALLELLFDAGMSVPEFTHLIRDRSVRAAASRIGRERGRVSRSRVAIITGLPRTVVSRILNGADNPPPPARQQSPARRVLAGWYENPDYLQPSGEPAALPIFARRRSFESLVGAYGGGIPVRAMLDELTDLGAIEQLPEQRVRPLARLTVLTGATPAAIAAVGERGKDLLETLAWNVRNRGEPLFEATALVDDLDEETLALIRRDVAAQGASFITGIHSLLGRHRKRGGGAKGERRGSRRVGVTAYYFEDRPGARATAAPSAAPRKNLRRAAKSSGRKKRSKNPRPR